MCAHNGQVLQAGSVSDLAIWVQTELKSSKDFLELVSAQLKIRYELSHSL